MRRGASGAPAEPDAVRWRKRRIVRGLIDFGMIVAGVLVALAANAWWAGREDDRRAADYRVRLAAEVRENRALADHILVHTSRIQAATDSLSALFEEDPGAVAPDRALIHAYNATRRWGRGFESSTFVDLTNTGNWRLLPDVVLRAEISGAYAHMGRYTQDWYGAEYRTAARRSIPIRLQFRVRDECPAIASPDWDGCPLEVDEEWAATTAEALRDDDELRGAYRIQAHELAIFVRDLTVLRTQLEQLLERLGPDRHP